MPNLTKTLALLLLLAAFACTSSEETKTEQPSEAPAADETASEPTAREAGAADLGKPVSIEEAWASPMDEADNVDSVAYWQGPDGKDVVVATGKESHQLLVYDAQTGELLRRVAGPGGGPGELQRPNGIMIEGDLAFVVERDNHRVQAFRLPELESVGTFGGDELQRPYGATVFAGDGDDPAGQRSLEIYVTDNYEVAEEQNGEFTTPPNAELGERVRHYRASWDGTTLEAEAIRAFGATEGPGVLRKVETLLADAPANRLLVADELDSRRDFKVYQLDGTFSGEVWGRSYFHHEPEGIALRACEGSEAGYWIATDQAKEVSYFRVFDRQTFTYRGTFIGPKTANTDGVTLTTAPSERFPEGAFFAVHDDQGVTAFDWRDVAAALELPGC